MLRVDTLISKLTHNGIPAALIHSAANMRYISGYTGEGCLLIAPGARFIITDFRYTEQASLEAPGFEIKKTATGVNAEAVVRDILAEMGITALGIEAGALTLSEYRALEKALGGVELKDLNSEAEDMRVIKDDAEIELIQAAARIACQAFDDFLGVLRPGITEKQARAELEYLMSKRGSEAPAFNTIVASGVNGSKPHAVPSDKVIMPGELVTFDFGCTYEGYLCDMTRTIAIGNVDDNLKKIYEATLAAQEMALESIAPGVPCKDIDKRARDYLEKLYPGAFGHGLGHGVGLLIHEAPRLSATSEAVLTKGHVVTVEPGVYLPGVGGCRIEDMAIITQTGYINPITAPKRLLSI